MHIHICIKSLKCSVLPFKIQIGYEVIQLVILYKQDGHANHCYITRNDMVSSKLYKGSRDYEGNLCPKKRQLQLLLKQKYLEAWSSGS